MILSNLKNSISNKPWFTLIELMVVITIIIIITMSLFEPYHYYQKKIKIKLATKDISQSLYDARNMAINWISSGSNSSIWVYLDSANKNKIQFLSYPYTFSWSSITPTISADIKLIKEVTLEQWIQIDKIWVTSLDTTWKSNWLFFFNSITWSWEFYTFSPNGNIPDENAKIKIDISYMWSSSPWLTQSLFYYTKTNIVDDEN